MLTVHILILLVLYCCLLRLKGNKRKKTMALVPCAACQVMNGTDCITPGQICIMAPYFPSTEPEKFERVHKIFGADNVFKILSGLNEPWERENAVNALCYEAEARINDPTHGYVGLQLVLEDQLNNLKEKIESTKNELAITMGPYKVPKYSNLPVPDDFHSTPALLPDLNEAQQNQLMQLPVANAPRMVDDIVQVENQELGDVHGDAGASSSAGPSMTVGSIGDTLPFPENQN